MKSTTLLALTLSLSLPMAAAGAPVALFNGKDLQGWTFDHKEDVKPGDVWSVHDGILVCKGRPAGVIRTKKSCANYELTVEWRWPSGPGGNSGVLVHASTPRQLDIWPKSIEVQLAAGDAGDFWTIGETIEVPDEGARRQGRRILNLTADSEKPPGEWNSMRVRCAGNTVTVWVNGDLVNHGTNASVAEGAICLQSEGTEIHFRKVELRPLK